MEKIRWGILGTGKIAQKFTEGLAALPDAELIAVGSRTQASADSFALQWKIPHAHGSYDRFVEDEAIDVVYIATPHPLHRENTVACLRAGKAVLCEKPFAMTAKEAQEMVAVAREKRILLMEAMWTRYFPAMEKVRSILLNGELGEVRLVQADFCFQPAFDPDGRLFNRVLGGGALLDLGIYPVSLASMVFGGSPLKIVSNARIGVTGVDEQASVIMEYPEGRQAVMTFGFLFDSPKEALIGGTTGCLRMNRPWWHPETLTWTKADGQEKQFTCKVTGNGYGYEAIEVMDCLRAGRLESPRMPLDESISIMNTLDVIRAQWGLCYPADSV
jgi:predicted dehydrogenase